MLTVEDLMVRWQVSRRTVYRMLESGKLRGVKVGGTWRFRKDYIKRLENK